MSKTKKKHPIVFLVIMALLMAALTFGCVYGRQMIVNSVDVGLEDRIAEAKAINEQRDREYQMALAEFEHQSTGGANLAWPAQKSEGWDVVDLTNYPLENSRQVSANRQDLMYNGMLLINQWHSRPDDFDESGVVSVGSTTKNQVQVSDYQQKLFPVAIDALREALDAAKEEGFEYYMLSEGYRSWEYQQNLFDKKVDQLKNKYSGEALIEAAKKQVNYPGTSEYNSGLSFSLRMYNKNDASVGKPAFSETDAGQWMINNSWKYGLVFRFQLADFPLEGCMDKSYKTGVSAKLNLFRYVGKGNAAAMHALDFCMEEYIDYLNEHPHIAVFEDGQLRYEIYRQYVGNTNTVTLDVTTNTANYVSSLDNMGYVITVFNY